MGNDPQSIQDALKQIFERLDAGFWTHIDFWISLTVGSAALFFSVRAFMEAKSAREAATEAGRTVKIQTITIELAEIAQKLDKLEPKIKFSEARDLLTEISRRLRRLTSPFSIDPDLKETIKSLLEALANAKSSLNSVHPSDPMIETDAPNSVYYAIESDFATINNFVADLMGLLETKSINFGDK